jgi:soluble lytic murein transglycosylase-like protein
LVRELLQKATEQTLSAEQLDAQYHGLYRHLVLATAWQESCWRQFIRTGDTIAPLKSSGGSVGLMQINQQVWRGIYDQKGLLGDMAYNGRAGCEILLHYLRDFAIGKGEHRKPGGDDNLAHATYAAYNGGPSQLSRYRLPDTKPSLKKIDALWWQKYQAVREGREMDVVTCYE